MQYNSANLVRCFEQPVDPRDLIDQRNVLPEGVQRWSGGLREVGAVERIRVI